MKDKDIITIDNKEFSFNEFYNRLQSKDNNVPSIACPKCLNTNFSISYKQYQCIANCKCGHSMTIYDG